MLESALPDVFVLLARRVATCVGHHEYCVNLPDNPCAACETMFFTSGRNPSWVTLSFSSMGILPMNSKMSRVLCVCRRNWRRLSDDRAVLDCWQRLSEYG